MEIILEFEKNLEIWKTLKILNFFWTFRKTLEIWKNVEIKQTIWKFGKKFGNLKKEIWNLEKKIGNSKKYENLKTKFEHVNNWKLLIG